MPEITDSDQIKIVATATALVNKKINRNKEVQKIVKELDEGCREAAIEVVVRRLCAGFRLNLSGKALPFDEWLKTRGKTRAAVGKAISHTDGKESGAQPKNKMPSMGYYDERMDGPSWIYSPNSY